MNKISKNVFSYKSMGNITVIYFEEEGNFIEEINEELYITQSGTYELTTRNNGKFKVFIKVSNIIDSEYMGYAYSNKPFIDEDYIDNDTEFTFKYKYDTDYDRGKFHIYLSNIYYIITEYSNNTELLSIEKL